MLKSKKITRVKEKVSVSNNCNLWSFSDPLRTKRCHVFVTRTNPSKPFWEQLVGMKDSEMKDLIDEALGKVN